MPTVKKKYTFHADKLHREFSHEKLGDVVVENGKSVETTEEIGEWLCETWPNLWCADGGKVKGGFDAKSPEGKAHVAKLRKKLKDEAEAAVAAG